MRKISLLFTILYLGVICIAITGQAAPTQKKTKAPRPSATIALVVNDDAIALSDVNDRIKLILASSGLPDNEEIRAKLMPQIINALIEEQLRLQEAKHLDQEVSQQEIDNGFAQIAKQNNMPPEQFRAILKRTGINIATLEAQIRSQVAWGKVVQAKIRPQIVVSPSDIDSKLARIEQAKGKTEYLTSEIFLPVQSVKDEGQVQQLATRLAQEIRSGKAPFFKVAQQFSQAAGAAAGGDLGWIQEGQLDPELDAALPKIEKGKISNPLRTISGFHILFVREQRTISDKTMPTRDQIMNAIGQERLERQAQRYLMDLKAAAFIDNRLDD